MNIRRSAIPLALGALWPCLALAGTVTIGPPESMAPPVPGQAKGLHAELWKGSVDTLDQARSLIGSRAADGTFTASTLDYPGGEYATMPTFGAFKDFLGADLASYAGLRPTNANSFVIRFTGQIYVPLAGQYNFRVGSDDGFNLAIGGLTVTSFTTDRSFLYSFGSARFNTAGLYGIEIIYWASRSSDTGLRVLSNLGKARGDDEFDFRALSGGDTYLRAQVPAPATMLVGACGLAVCGARRRR